MGLTIATIFAMTQHSCASALSGAI